MLEKKIKEDIETVNRAMEMEEIKLTDQGKDALRSVLRNGSGFDGAIDKIIEEGKKEGKKMFPIIGRK